MLFKRHRSAKVAFTPETLAQQGAALSSHQQRVFQLVQRKDERAAERARALLVEHVRQTGRAIPLDQHDRLCRQMGWNRSMQAGFIVILPLVGTVLWGLGHPSLGIACLLLAVIGLVSLNVWRSSRLQRMELAPLEVTALKKVALADETARVQFLRWKKDGLPLTQEEFLLVENWMGARRQVQQWEEARALADQLRPAGGRRFRRNHRS